MVSICDFLATADLCVEDVTAGTDDLVNGLGLQEPSAGSRQPFPNEGWDVLFTVVSKPFASAPTRLELLAALDQKGTLDARPAREIVDSQGPRRILSHATVIATPRFDDLLERVRSRGIPIWFQPPEEDGVPFARLWIGISDENLAHYDRRVDLGMRLEFIPSGSVALPAKIFERPVDKPRKGEAGFRRIVSRDFVVEDLAEALAHLEITYDWIPAHEVRQEAERGYSFVTMSSNHRHGASLRLLQSSGAQASGTFGPLEGDGAGRIAIAAFDLDLTAEDMERRGLSFTRLPAGDHDPEAIIPQLPYLGDAIMIVQDTPLT